MNILILYGTLEGQTAKIAERMADVIRNKGHQVTTQLGEQLPANFVVEKYDAVVIGGSIHMSKYPGYLKKFITSHSYWLKNVPSAFFTVCMAVNSQHAKSREEAKQYGEEFFKEVSWQPKIIATFAGAVKYTQYNFITRFIMKMISKREGGSTDTSVDHEYTDWEAVVRFTEKFLEEVNELQSV